MQFEWDAQKNKTNLQKHKIDFNDALHVFHTEHVVYISKNAGSDAKRLVAVGVLDKVMLAMVFTERGNVIRIISARRARDGEKKLYRESFGSAGKN